MTERRPWAQTLTGGWWYPFDPHPEDVRFEDLRALSRVSRFGGHTTIGVDLYSVAEHAVRVAWLVRDLGGSVAESLAALHHDSHEAYPPGDQLGPFLRALRSAEACELLGLTPGAFEGLLRVEARAKDAVRSALGVANVFEDEPSARLIKRADTVLLATERRDLMAPSEVEWGALPEPLPDRIRPWIPRVAWSQFTTTHETLTRQL